MRSVRKFLRFRLDFLVEMGSWYHLSGLLVSFLESENILRSQRALKIFCRLLSCDLSNPENFQGIPKSPVNYQDRRHNTQIPFEQKNLKKL